MIRNIVFDLGGVLIDWRPCDHLMRTFPGEVASVLAKEIFHHEDWKNMDRGVLPEDKLWEKKKRELPDYREYIERLEREVPEILKAIDENVKVLEELKKRGFFLYVLSNFGRIYFEKIRKKYDFFDLFDGIVVSAHVGYMKPEREIFEELIKRYNIVPEESLFVDDMEENVAAARRLGFHAIHLKDPSLLRKELFKFLESEGRL
ncbi:HAD family phosphatase [Thermotoga sp. KOL6]|uniref:HAD family hydrolase n=1 Tax=Thermotoga sp. KOL6 TaxID=126741 RepID=UPI000C7816E2|nr:HAD family phosphatase [Thermotoga sp. KOL6]PLV59343.1 haloacid dehalogenase [Thermotoga sp. KOL6]